MGSDDHDIAQVHEPDGGLAAVGIAELAALSEALELRVRSGSATLEDFGALARTLLELARREQEGRSARLRGEAQGA